MPIYGARLTSPGTCNLRREGRPIEARRVCVHLESEQDAIRAGCLGGETDCRIGEGADGSVYCCPQAVARDVAEVPAEMRGDSETPALWAIFGEPMSPSSPQQPDKPPEQQDQGGGFFGWISSKFSGGGGQQPQYVDPGKQIGQVVNQEVSRVAGTLEEAPEPEPEVQTASMFSGAVPWVVAGVGGLLVVGIIVGLVVRDGGEDE